MWPAENPEDERNGPDSSPEGSEPEVSKHEASRPRDDKHERSHDASTPEDINLVFLRGRLVAEPEIRLFESGTRMIRYLAAIRISEPSRRLDVVPVTVWNPAEALLRNPGGTRDRLMIVGTIQRRFWPATAGTRSRLEVVASSIQVERA